MHPTAHGSNVATFHMQNKTVDLIQDSNSNALLKLDIKYVDYGVNMDYARDEASYIPGMVLKTDPTKQPQVDLESIWSRSRVNAKLIFHLESISSRD